MDKTHTHMTFGFVDGCPGCVQLERDFARTRFANSEAHGLEDGATRLRAWYSIRRHVHQEFLRNPNNAGSLVPA